MMNKFIPIILASGVISFIMTPLVRRVAQLIGLTDQPNARKVHKTPVPLLGGLAIYIGLFMAVILSGTSPVRELAGILGGASVATAFGLWDDRRGMSPLLKLAGQVLAAIILIGSGIQVEMFPYPAANIALTILWIVGIINAINLLDNMDGLAAGIACVASAFFFILAVVEGLGLVASLAAATLGACVAFLYYNFNPASLFMGDAGSMLLGFVLAVLGIKLKFDHTPLAVAWLIPITILGLPIFDTTLVVFSRLRRHRPIYLGGKDHTSHRLIAIFAMTPARAVMTLYLVATALGLIGLILRDAEASQARILLGVLIAIFAGALIGLEWKFVLPLPPSQPPSE